MKSVWIPGVLAAALASTLSASVGERPNDGASYTPALYACPGGACEDGSSSASPAWARQAKLGDVAQAKEDTGKAGAEAKPESTGREEDLRDAPSTRDVPRKAVRLAEEYGVLAEEVAALKDRGLKWKEVRHVLFIAERSGKPLAAVADEAIRLEEAGMEWNEIAARYNVNLKEERDHARERVREAPAGKVQDEQMRDAPSGPAKDEGLRNDEKRQRDEHLRQELPTDQPGQPQSEHPADRIEAPTQRAIGNP